MLGCKLLNFSAVSSAVKSVMMSMWVLSRHVWPHCVSQLGWDSGDCHNIDIVAKKIVSWLVRCPK